MRRLIRDTTNGRFLTPDGAWSEDPSAAEDHTNFLTAFDRYRKLELTNAEYLLVMGETPSPYDFRFPLGRIGAIQAQLGLLLEYLLTFLAVST